MSNRIPIPSVGSDHPDWTARWLQATNQERARNGLSPYSHHHKLAEAARLRAEDMIREGYFGHDDPHDDPSHIDGKYWEILQQLGVTSYSWAGENLAANLHSPDPLGLALEGLMNSPTHRANILSRDFTHMGTSSQIRPDGWHLFVFVYAAFHPVVSLHRGPA